MSTTDRPCTGCGESWPDDQDFFACARNEERKGTDLCNACVSDKKREMNARYRPAKLPSPHITPAALQWFFRDLIATGLHR